MKKIFSRMDYKSLCILIIGHLLNTMIVFKQKQVTIPNSEFTRNSTISEVFSYPIVWTILLIGSLVCFLYVFILAYFKVKKNS